MHCGTNLSSRWTAPALVFLLGACALPLQQDPFARAEQGPQKVTLHVRNMNFSEATLWAVSRGGRQRLGTVGGKQDAVYTLTWSMPEPLRVEIDMLAGPRCRSEELAVDPGDILQLDIPLDIRQMYDCSGQDQS